MKRLYGFSDFRISMRNLLKSLYLQTALLSVVLLALISLRLNADPAAGQSYKQRLEVGKVLTSTGEVWLDAFGNNEFVEVIQGDLLYEKSVLRTEEHSQALILLGGQEKSVPARTLLVVKDVLATEVKETSIKWFGDVKEILEEALSALLSGEESVALGSRGTDARNSNDIFSLLEDNQPDIDALLTAKQKMGEKRYMEAAFNLQNIAAPEKLGFYSGELSYLKGACYFQLSYFQKAKEHFAASYASITKLLTHKGFKPYFVMPLLFQLASTCYMLNEEKEAVEYFRKILTLADDHEYKPYAYLFIIRYYLDAGKKDLADEHTRSLERYLENKAERNRILRYLKEKHVTY